MRIKRGRSSLGEGQFLKIIQANTARAAIGPPQLGCRELPVWLPLGGTSLHG